MAKNSQQKRLLLNLYLINAGVNMTGALIVGVLNLLTPTEFFKLWRHHIVDEVWIYILMMYPLIIALGAGLQYLAQRPLKKYFDYARSKGVDKSNLFRRARHRQSCSFQS